MNHNQAILLLEAIGASGMVGLITTVMTRRLSGSKQGQTDPNGERRRLADEVLWLRHQVDIAYQRGYIASKTQPPDED